MVLDQLNSARRRVLERLLVEELADEPAFVAQIRLLMLVGRHEEAALQTLDWAVHHLAKNRPSTALEALDIVVPALEDLEEVLWAQLCLVFTTCLAIVRPLDPQIGRSLSRAEALFRDAAITVRERNESEAEVLLTRAQIQRIIGHHPNFRRLLMDAWERIENAPATPLSVRIATLLGWSNRMAGYVDDAATWHGRARRLALEVGDPAVQAHADAGVAAWQFAHGLLSEAEHTAAGAIQVFAGIEDLGGLAEVVPTYTHSLRLQGRFSEALALLEDQIPMMREGEVPTFYVRLLLANAWCEVDLGRLGRAQEWVDELGAALRRSEHLDLRLEADLVWGRILVASGLHVDAMMRLRAVRDPAESAGLTVIAEVARALEAEAMWALGEQTPAVRAFRDAIGVLKDTGGHARPGVGLHQPGAGHERERRSQPGVSPHRGLARDPAHRHRTDRAADRPGSVPASDGASLGSCLRSGRRSDRGGRQRPGLHRCGGTAAAPLDPPHPPGASQVGAGQCYVGVWPTSSPAIARPSGPSRPLPASSPGPRSVPGAPSPTWRSRVGWWWWISTI